MQDNGPKTIGEVREEAAKVGLKAVLTEIRKCDVFTLLVAR